ncbi:MAG TPA: trehalose-6-phosphate synthase [Vicinamibacterales bacterium]|nr:trehalose-6-phosphate synthase [Vicinamibacterales bacterium]
MRIVRFTITLVAALAVLTWGASVVVHRTTNDWFERDLRLRAQLAVTGARQSLVAHWDTAEGLAPILADLTHDERIMAAAACGADFRLRAETEAFPQGYGCGTVGDYVRVAGDAGSAGPVPWYTVVSLPGGRVHLSAIPLADGDRPLGFVVLAHDLSFVERRDARMQQLLLIAFGVLALATSVVTLVAARWSWTGWSNELRRLLRGDIDLPEFRPFVREVREFVDRILAETERDRESGLWTPERLKRALTRYLHGEKIVIVANREPYIHERLPNGEIKVVHPASGLVTALEPVMRACSGVWIAHGSGSADRDTVDAHDRVAVPPDEKSYLLRRLWLEPEEEKGYYYGFANEGLWPLCHLADARPIFRRDDWEHYQTVNRRFAEAVCAEVESDDPIVLVQDYHFALAPALIRKRLPRATILMFWHIPWPNAERFGICPWRDALLEGMLGASILGFHTQSHCNNFIDSVDRFLEARIDREGNAVVRSGRATMVRPYPISLEWPSHWLSTAPPVDVCRQSVIADLKLRPDALIGLGVDRLDYTKGVEERFLAVERLLDKAPDLRGRFTFVQLAAPSRSIIERYRQLNDNVEQLAARINDRFGSDTYKPIVLLRAHHEPPTVFRYYRAADLCYVSSLHDGMNLVAKEFVAARDDERGVLVLSRFTGAARELSEAVIVNPYDIDEASAALAGALEMSAAEQRARMRSMRALIAEFNVYRWAGRMIVDAARLRRRRRLTGRLREWGVGAMEEVAL